MSSEHPLDGALLPKWNVNVSLSKSGGNMGDVQLYGGKAEDKVIAFNNSPNTVWLKKVTEPPVPFKLDFEADVQLPCALPPFSRVVLGTVSTQGKHFYGKPGVKTAMVLATFETERVGYEFDYMVHRMKLGFILKVCAVDNSNMYKSALNPIALKFVPKKSSGR